MNIWVLLIRFFKRRLKYLPEDVLAAKVGHFDEAVLHRVRVLTLDLCGQTVQKKISIQNPTSDVMLMLGETRASYSGN